MTDRRTGCTGPRWLVAALVFAGVVGATPAAAQAVGIGGASSPAVNGYMPGGPGLQAWLSAEPFSLVRVRASASRGWGRASEASSTCLSYWPDAVGCVQEQVRYRNDVSSAQLALQLMTPEVAGFRFGAGVSGGYHRVEVGRRGLETGRTEEPVVGAEGTRPGVGWLLSAERSLLRSGLRLEAAAERFRIDFGNCVMDTWALCEAKTFTRYTLGLGFSPR